jgi:hypothetical protein
MDGIKEGSGKGVTKRGGSALKPKKDFKWSNFFGKALIVLGGLSILDFASPIPIPTTFGAAFVTGGLFIAVGVFLLVKDRIPWDRVATGAAKTMLPAQPEAPKVKIDPLLPVRILKLSMGHKGILTQSTVAMELNIPLEQAEAGLDECIRFGHCVPDFDMAKEITVYRFTEHLEAKPGEQGLIEED